MTEEKSKTPRTDAEESRLLNMCEAYGRDTGPVFGFGKFARQLETETQQLAGEKKELLEALKLARAYVHTLHMNIANAMGHENTVVRPDLDIVDAALSKRGA